MLAFKTLEKLEKKGFTREQAEGSLEAWAEFMSDNLASKSDLLAVRNELKEEIHKIDKELLVVKHNVIQLGTHLSGMENRLMVKLGGYFTAILSLAVTVLAIIIKHS